MSKRNFKFFPTTFTTQFIQDLKDNKITLAKETMGGAQSSLLIATRGLEKFIISLKKQIDNRFITSLEEEKELCRRLVLNPHPNVMEIYSANLTDSTDLIQALIEKASIEEYKDSKLRINLNNFVDILEIYEENLLATVINKEMESKISYLKQITIGEYVGGVTLDKFFNLDEKSKIKLIPISEEAFENILILFNQIYLGILHIHFLFGAHGDISLRNILILTVSNKIKIVDLCSPIAANTNGRAENMRDREKGTLANMAPEVFLSAKEAAVGKIDAYSLCILLLQMLFKTYEPYNFKEMKKLPETFPEEYLKKKYEALLNSEESWINDTLLKLLPNSHNGKKIKELLKKGLKIKPESRLHIADFLYYLDFSQKEKIEIIINNILLAFKHNNLSYIQSFYQSMKDEDLDEDNFLPNPKILLDFIIRNSKQPIHFILLALTMELGPNDLSSCLLSIDKELENKKSKTIDKINLNNIKKFITISRTEEKIESIEDKLPSIDFTRPNDLKNFLTKYVQQYITENSKNINLNTAVPIANVFLIALEKLAELEDPDKSIIDLEKCIRYLKYIDSFYDQYPENPFIKKLHEIYQDLSKKRTAAVIIAEIKDAASVLIQATREKKIDDIITLIQQSDCYVENPIFYRSAPTHSNALDHLVHFIHQTKNKILKDHLIKSAYPTDKKAEYKWTKLNLIESHLLYALARHKNHVISALPGTLDRIFKHLEKFNIDFKPKLTSMVVDKDDGYYVCDLDEKKFDQVISSSKAR